MKVTVIDKQSGKPRLMDERFARILTKLGRATYMTRDMRAAQAPSPAADDREDEPAKEAPARRARKAKADE